jgi:Amt family ammonium transporter
MVVMLAVNATGLLRLDAEGEMYGMDLTEHGIPAYPEYVLTAAGTPKGLVHFEPAAAPAGIPVAHASRSGD